MSRVVVVLCVTVVLGLAIAAGSKPAGTIHPCASYQGHLFEACFAYVINDSGLALRDFYAKGQSADDSEASDAVEDFHYRFRGQARSVVTRRVAGWPQGRKIVGIPTIRIIAATASLGNNTALLTTRETWRVATSAGRVLCCKPERLYHVSMARVQGKVFHIWVVVAIR